MIPEEGAAERPISNAFGTKKNRRKFPAVFLEQGSIANSSISATANSPSEKAGAII
jgi:hypothetical protein